MTKQPDANAPHARRRGFTLIEVMIVVAVLGIVAALAMPSFMSQVRKARRAEAVSALSQIQQAQERFRANCTCYANSITAATSTACPATCPAATPGLGIAAITGARYTYALSGVTATGYTVTATAVSGSSQASDTGCTTLSVVVANGAGTNSQPNCWSR
jgi:type IV pilus assembly protein PilE